MSHVPMDPIDPFMRRARRLDRCILFVFVAILCAPHLDHVLREDAERGPFREQRHAAARPAPAKNLAELRTFPLAYQNYWNDAFGLRDVLLRGNAILKAFGFGVLPGIDHVLGKDGWIFWRGRRILDVWRGAAPLSAQELEDWSARLEHRRAQCAALGARYLFVFCPEKPTIYPEYLPDRFDKIGPTRLDQLFDHLRGRSDVDVLDLRPVLLAAKAGDRPGRTTYYELGTHWRARGAAIGCAAILAHLKAVFPALRPLGLDEFEAHDDPGAGDTEARALYLEDHFTQREESLVPRTPLAEVTRLGGFPRVRSSRVPSKPEYPRAVIFHDSFGAYLERPMSEAFSQLTMVWNYIFDEELVRREQPDVVIELFAERTLVTLDPRDLGAATNPVRTAFEQSSDVRYRLDVANLAQLTAMYRTTLSAKPDAEGTSTVEFTGFGAPDCFVLPEIDLAGERLIFRVDITAPVATPLAIYFKRKGDANYSPDHKVEVAITAGRNERFLVLDAKDLIDRLVVSPGTAKGSYLLHALEIRRE